MKYETIWEATIAIDPVSKARPRFTKRGFVYTPAKTKDYETLIKASLAKAFGQEPIEDRPLRLDIDFFIEKPRTSKRYYPTVKPDLDNLAKAILDAANKVLFKDDALICDMTCRKRYASDGYIQLRLSYLDCVVSHETLAT